ncbi:hypothetical protein BH11ACT5_BH11ACT5_00960 [soil metagenome]
MWVFGVVSAVPELTALYESHVRANGALDGEVFVSMASRWAAREGVTEPVLRLLSTLERDYALSGPKVRGIIEGSFVEPLAADPLVHHFGPNLRRAGRPHSLGHGER